MPDILATDKLHQQERPPYAPLEEEVALLENQLADAYAGRNDVYGEQATAIQKRIDKFDASYDKLCAVAIADEQSPPSYTEFLADKDVPEAYKAFAPAIDELKPTLDVKKAKLETHTPEKAADVRAKAAGLEASVDYDKAVGLIYNSGNLSLGRELDYIIGARILLDDQSHQVEYSQLQNIDNVLDNAATVLETHNLFGAPQEIPTEIAELETQRERASVEVPQIYEITMRCSDLVTKYKDENPEFSQKVRDINSAALKASNILAQLPAAIRSTTTYQEFNEWGREVPYMNSVLEAALLRYTLGVKDMLDENFELSTESESYQDFVERARSIDVDHILDSLEIREEYTWLPVDFDANMIRKLAKVAVPPLALEAVKRIEVRPLVDEEKAKDNMLGFCAFDKQLGALKIVISSDEIIAEYKDQSLLARRKHAADIEGMAAKETFATMRRTLLHEYSHAFHLTAPLAALDRWDRVCEQDPTRITQYVQKAFDTDNPHKFAEDFADSGATFTTAPHNLVLTSASRFDGMAELYHDFMSGYDTNLRNKQMRRIAQAEAQRHTAGISDDTMRTRLLTYED